MGAEPQLRQPGRNGEFTFSGLPSGTFKALGDRAGHGGVITTPVTVAAAGEARHLPKIALPLNLGVTEVYRGCNKPSNPVMRTGFNLDFRDPAGLIRYPVNESMVNGAHVFIRNYAETGHITMHISIPAIRVADWPAP